MDGQQIFNHLKSCFAYLFKSAPVRSAFLSQQISTDYRPKPAGHVSKYVLVRKYTIYKLLESYESEESLFVWCLAYRQNTLDQNSSVVTGSCVQIMDLVFDEKRPPPTHLTQHAGTEEHH